MKNLSYSLRGGIIALLVAIALVLTGLVSEYMYHLMLRSGSLETRGLLFEALATPYILIVGWPGFFAGMANSFVASGLKFYSIFSSLIFLEACLFFKFGAIIGSIYGKRKNRNYVKP
jgi:hypothetical protein